MSTTKQEVKTLEDLLSLVKPKTIHFLLEVTKDHTFDDVNEACRNVDRLDSILNRIETHLDYEPDITTALVFEHGIPKDQCQVIPTYSFITPKINWATIRKSDLSFIRRLDNKLEIVNVADKFEITPFTLID